MAVMSSFFHLFEVHGIYNFEDNLEIRCAFFGKKSIYTFAKAKDISFSNLFISNGYKIYVFGFKLE